MASISCCGVGTSMRTFTSRLDIVIAIVLE
jgi:hypothetical protein